MQSCQHILIILYLTVGVFLHIFWLQYQFFISNRYTTQSEVI